MRFPHSRSFAAVLTLATASLGAQMPTMSPAAVHADSVYRAGNYAAAPCESRPESRQFDFWVGEWDVTTPKGAHAGSSSVQKILGGCVVFENWTPASGAAGKSLNAYNSKLKMWQQFWTSASGNVTEYRQSNTTWKASFDLYYHRKGVGGGK